MAELNLNRLIEGKKDIWVRNPSRDMRINLKVTGMEGVLPAIDPGETRCLSEELSYKQIDESDLRKLIRPRAGKPAPLMLLDPDEMADTPKVPKQLEPPPEVTTEDQEASRVKTTIITEAEINPRIQQIKLSLSGKVMDAHAAIEELRRLEPNLQDQDLAFMQTGKDVPAAVKKWAATALEKRQKPAPVSPKGKQAGQEQPATTT